MVLTVVIYCNIKDEKNCRRKKNFQLIRKQFPISHQARAVIVKGVTAFLGPPYLSTVRCAPCGMPQQQGWLSFCRIQ